jgi:hypothetical protein
MEAVLDCEEYAASWVYPIVLEHLRLKHGKVFEIVPVPKGIPMQHKHGDYWAKAQQSQLVLPTELKSERRHTGNLAIETWSDEPNYVPGWIAHYGDHVTLLYAFNDRHVVYGCKMGDLRKWANSPSKPSDGEVAPRRRIDQFPEKTPHVFQRNVTVIRLVPAEVFLCEVAGAFCIHRGEAI